jgi:cytochrome b561
LKAPFFPNHSKEAKYMNVNETAVPRHSLATRMMHALFAAAIMVQLATSYVMHGPRRGLPGDGLFTVHQYAGMAAAVLALGFWLVLVARRHGTSFDQLFPWFSDRRLAALWADVVYHVRALVAFRLPDYREDSAFASAVHGLGLLLMTAMAITGCVYFYGLSTGIAKTAVFSLDLVTHKLLAKLAWAYLIGHAGLGLIHHYTARSSLAGMWSLERGK